MAARDVIVWLQENPDCLGIELQWRIEEAIEEEIGRLDRELRAAIVWIEQLTDYTNPDPSAPGQEELLEQLRAALSSPQVERAGHEP